MSEGYSEIFSGMRALNFGVFQAYVFRQNWKEIEEPKRVWRGSGGMLAGKFFENLHTAMAILVLFEQFWGLFGLSRGLGLVRP